MTYIEQSLSPTEATAEPPRVSWTILACGAIVADFAVIVVSAMLSGSFYYLYAFGHAGASGDHLTWGAAFGLVFVAITLARSGYRYNAYVRVRRRFDVLWLDWNVTVGTVLALLFVMKSGSDISRIATILLYLTGFVSLALLRLGTIRVLRGMVQAGTLRARRQLVIGHRAGVETFLERHRGDVDGGVIVDRLILDDGASLDGNLLARVRMMNPDDIILAVPWSATDQIERLTDSLMSTPAAIHLAPERFLDVRDGVGVPMQAAPVTIVRAPMACPDRFLKRTFDIVIASLALLALSPVLAVVALLIKLDSRGPVLFRQARHGFNNQTFRVFKFRTMTVAEDGDAFRQATRGDTRITRIGRLLRRSSIDELPQLLNVLIGDMSIVGPRPHPVALNMSFDGRVARFARRHIVKPGITGWAQIHGLRGETQTEGKMQARVAYDLYYLENWSFWLDVRIVLLTAIFAWTSAEAF